MTRLERDIKLNLLYSEKLNLNSELSKTDYKVIKCAEATALQLLLPYDIEKLHKERQLKRDRINEIDSEISELEDISEFDIEDIQHD